MNLSNVLVSWLEPEDEIWFCDGAAAAAMQRETADRRGFNYDNNDLRAFWDFVAVNWASIDCPHEHTRLEHSASGNESALVCCLCGEQVTEMSHS